MLYFSRFTLLFLTLFISLLGTGCPKNEMTFPRSDQPTRWPITSKYETVNRFFTPREMRSVVHARQREFLTRERLTVKSRGRIILDRHFETDVQFTASYHPAVPRVGKYDHDVAPGHQFALRFSSDFFLNLPLSIQTALADYDIESLDLFLMVQDQMKYVTKAQYPQLVTHFWALPKMPGSFSGVIYDRYLAMGLFEPDRDLAREIQIGRMQDFQVTIHDNALSPNTAGLKIGLSELNSSFWSVVVEPKSKRAAVTLHYLARDYFAPIWEVWDRHTAEEVLNHIQAELPPDSSFGIRLRNLIAPVK